MTSALYIDEKNPPDWRQLGSVLGDSAALWADFVEYLTVAAAPLAEEWKFFGKKSGWTLVLKKRKQAIVYLFPAKECFQAYYMFAEKAIAEAESASLPESIVQEIKNAELLAEGRSFRITIRTADDLAMAKKLANIKLHT